MNALEDIYDGFMVFLEDGEKILKKITKLRKAYKEFVIEQNQHIKAKTDKAEESSSTRMDTSKSSTETIDVDESWPQTEFGLEGMLPDLCREHCLWWEMQASAREWAKIKTNSRYVSSI